MTFAELHTAILQSIFGFSGMNGITQLPALEDRARANLECKLSQHGETAHGKLKIGY